MNYEAFDWYDLGDSARTRYLQADELEDDMTNPGAKRFIEAPKKPYTTPHLYTGDELPVEIDGMVFFDLPPIQSRTGTNWESVEVCRREARAKLDRSELRRGLVNAFWAVLIVGSLLAGAVWAVRALYTVVMG